MTYDVTETTTTASYKAQSSQVTTNVTGSCNASFNVNDPAFFVVQSIKAPNGTSYTFKYDPTYGLVNEVDYPGGGWVKYKWKLSDTFSEIANFDGSSTSSDDPLRGSCIFEYQTPVVSERTVGYSQGSPAAQTQTFTYNTTFSSVGQWTAKTTTVATTDNVSGKQSTTVYTYGPIARTVQVNEGGELPTELPVETSVLTYDNGTGSTSTLLQTVNKSWADQFQMTGQQTLLAGGQSSEQTYCYDGNTDLIQEKDEYGFGVAGPSLASPATSSNPFVTSPITCSSPIPTRRTVIGYSFSTPCSTTIYDSSGNRAAETDSYIDGGSSICLSGAGATQAVSGLPSSTHDETNYGSGAGPRRGNVTKTVRWLNTGASVTTTAAYDETGQMISSTDGNNHTTEYVYTDSPASSGAGNTNAYLTQITDPLSHVQKYSYSYITGQVASATDPNENVTTYTYNDPLRRLTNTAYPDGGQTTIAYNDSVPSITTTVASSPNPAKSTVAVMDGMGHVTQTQLTTDPTGTDYIDIVYDGMGQIYSVSNPHGSQTLSSDGVTTYLRDALGRLTLQTQPDTSTQTYTYVGNTTTSMDEISNTWKRTSDALGRLTQVIEPGALETDYGYDALDNLTSVAQHGTAAESARSRSFTYDSLSRLLTSTNPETGNNGQPGTICYGLTGSGSCQNGYDANGNLASKTDARGVVTQYSYDALNRLIGKVYTNAPAGSLSSCYQYDTATNGVGRLAASWTQAGSCPSQLPVTGFLTSRVYVTYDVMGRLKQQQQCVPGQCEAQAGSPFTMNYAYDLAGNTASMGDGLGQVSWALSYDGAGRLSTVNGAAAPGLPNPAQLFANPVYNPAGQLTNWNVGAVNGSTPALTGMRTYDNRLRVTTETVAGHD